MNLKKVIAMIIVFSMIMVYGCVYADNEDSTSSSTTLPYTNGMEDSTSSSTTLPYTNGMEDSTSSSTTLPHIEETEEEREKWLNQQIEFDYIYEVEQGTTINRLIEQVKEEKKKKRIEEAKNDGWYQEDMTFKYEISEVFAINGTTNKDRIENSTRLTDNDIARTNIEIHIAESVYRGGVLSSGSSSDWLSIGIVVLGDLTGTGEIDVTDVSTMQEELVETIQLKGLYKKAADMDNSEEVDIIDLSQLQEYIVNN